MTFADEMAVVMSVRYERVHVTGPDAESFSCIPAHRSSPNTEGMHRFFLFLSLSITHTPSTRQLLLCRTRSVVADKWTRSNKDHLPENKKKWKKKRLRLSFDDDLPPLISGKWLARHLTDRRWYTVVSSVFCYCTWKLLLLFFQFSYHLQCRTDVLKSPGCFLGVIKYITYKKLI